MEHFEALAIEKKQAIIQAGLSVFAEYPYAKASTELIARRARISKGLLFYYFQNKENLYHFLYHYAATIIAEALAEVPETTDFIAYLAAVDQTKFKIFARYPTLNQFLQQALAQRERYPLPEVQQAINKQPTWQTKFAQGWSAEKVMRELSWLLEGYLVHQRQLQQPFDWRACEANYNEWLQQYRRLAVEKGGQ